MNEPTWFRKYRNTSERFAHVVDATDGSVDEREQAEFSKELELVSALRGLGSEPVLDNSARERILRSIEEGLRSETALQTRSPAVALRRRKGTIITAAAAAGFIAVGGLGVVVAQSSLPGDLLYDIKRTTESIALDLTFEPTERALKHLELAAERVSELEALAARHSDGGFAAPAVYQEVLADLDAEATAASREASTIATQHGGRLLPAVSDWAARQTVRMNDIKASIPGAVVLRFEQSVELLQQIERRADTLAGRMDCYRITSGLTDRLGEVPAQGACDFAVGTSSPAVNPSASSKRLPPDSQTDAQDPQQDASVLPGAPPSDTDPVEAQPDSPEVPGDVPPVDDVDPNEPSDGLTIPTLLPPPTELGKLGEEITP